MTGMGTELPRLRDSSEAAPQLLTRSAPASVGDRAARFLAAWSLFCARGFVGLICPAPTTWTVWLPSFESSPLVGGVQISAGRRARRARGADGQSSGERAWAETGALGESVLQGNQKSCPTIFGMQCSYPSIHLAPPCVHDYWFLEPGWAWHSEALCSLCKVCVHLPNEWGE